MIEIVKKTIDFYIKNGKTPVLWELDIKPWKNEKASLFITLYYKWEVRWSAWNIKEIANSKEEEIIKNTIAAISWDKRFETLSINEAKDVKVRIDTIKSRRVLWNSELQYLEPINSWIIAIKKDYKKIAVILPNISASILMWKDFEKALTYKLWEKFEEKNYIIYEIKTEIEKDF